MQARSIQRFLNDLPILPKLLLIPAIPFLSLMLFSALLYLDVQSVLQDEERLNDLYRLQKTSAQYMRLVIDLENTFRGYVISDDDRYLLPYQQAREGIITVGEDLATKLPPQQEPQFKELQRLVMKLVTEKERLVQSMKIGDRQEAVEHVAEGRARDILAEIRKSMAHLEQVEQHITQQELSRLSYDRTVTSFVILGGGLITLCLVIFALALIAHSIATPIAALSRVVGCTAGDLVPSIPVLERRDEIGELTRVMKRMSLQIRHDLEEVQQSEAALKKLHAQVSASEAKYRGLVDHAPFGIVMTKGVQITFSNRYNQELAGLDPQENLDPATFRQHIHPEDRDRVLSTFSQAVAEGRSCEMIFRFLREDGHIRTILSRHVPIMELESAEAVYVGFNIDITTLDDLRSRLSRAEKLATLGQVAAGIAHELRNPLVGIGSTATVLLDELTPNDPKSHEIEVILSETRRLDRIVNQIVNYARPRQVVPTQVDLAGLMDEVTKLLKPRLEQKHLSVHTSLSPLPHNVHADRDQLRQVLLNVVDNAIDATPEGGAPIEVTAHELFRSDRHGMVIHVKDAGTGIPQELLSRVFQPFVTVGKRHGTGLGLAICKNIVESHEGDIYVSSEVGKGTTVGIWLPSEYEPSLSNG